MVAALVDSGPAGTWAEEHLGSGQLVAPHLMPIEATNILRRLAHGGQLSAEAAGLAHADLLDLPVELVGYQQLAARVWELRANVTTYDACYVVLAELLEAPLATLDSRLTRASGPRCAFLTPLTPDSDSGR